VDEDTVPQNTLAPVDAVINPLRSGPGDGIAPAATGQRYLLTQDTGSGQGSAAAWQGEDDQALVAHANDIVEYQDGRWRTVFDSTNSPVNTQYVTNITTGIQYRWTGEAWVKSYQGIYPGGSWTLVL